jgi:hypothetical protein
LKRPITQKCTFSRLTKRFKIEKGPVQDIYTDDGSKNLKSSRYNPLGVEKMFWTEPTNLKMKLTKFFDAENHEIYSEDSDSDK